MKRNLKLSDFTFKFAGYGLYLVTFQSPQSGKSWKCMTSDMTIIDATKNADEPLKKDLEILKRLVKRESRQCTFV